MNTRSKQCKTKDLVSERNWVSKNDFNRASVHEDKRKKKKVKHKPDLREY